MAIIDKKKKPFKKREIDLTGPDGNVFVLMGYARNWGRQLELDVPAIIADMTSGDYENALKVFDSHFGEVCDLVR